MTIKYEDASMLKYYWKEKGDMARYSGYEKLLPLLEEEYPLLLEGLNKTKQGEDLVEIMLDKIISESDYDED
tara:strand:- start:3203 stop:3418 length:216 start_codon:yes stop_codon:yes gene_type:complete